MLRAPPVRWKGTGGADFNKATATIPADVARGEIMMHDPLPPPDSVEGYQLVLPPPALRGGTEDAGALNALARFLQRAGQELPGERMVQMLERMMREMGQGAGAAFFGGGEGDGDDQDGDDQDDDDHDDPGASDVDSDGNDDDIVH